MEKEKNVAEVVPEETVVNESEVTTPAQEEVTEEVASTQEVKPEVKDNRPVENVAWEVKRKLDETIPTLQNEIRELKTFITENRQPSTPTYTKAQLQAYASEPTTTTEQRLWAYTEVDKLEKEDRKKEYETLVTSTQRKTESEVRRNQSAQWVSQTFPDTVVKDPMGNVMGWNNQSPVLARANEYMNRSETLRNDPEGFMAAVKMAAFDLGVTPTSNKKVDRTVAQLRKEQKKQLASSGGTRIVETSEVAKKNRMERLKEEYAKTGNKKIFEEMVKIRGLNPYI
jgi:hypothetical protein